MKAAINGKRYNTKKANLIGTASSHGLSVDDLGHWAAGLYRSPRVRRYFLAGRGGPMTRWRNNGSGIVPMTPEEALAWAERYLDADAIEQHFGDAIEEA